MNVKSFFYIAFVGFTILHTACAQSLPQIIDSEVQVDEVFSSTSGQITERQLQAEIVVFADQYTMVVWQAMDEIQRSGLAPERKLQAEYNKLLYISSAMSIAAQPSPVASLLDMITFIHLGHQAMKNYWVPEVYGSAGNPLLTV